MLITLFVLGCNQQHVYKQLELADRLMEERQNDSAHEVLNKIAIEGVDDPACVAYYWLLKIQSDYRLYVAISSAEKLDNSMHYYEQHHDADKLMRCYYYKGSISGDQGNNKESIVYLKKAEELLAKASDDNPYLISVNEAIAMVNVEADQYPLAVDHQQKAIKYAVIQKDTAALTYDYMNMGAIYYEMEKGDSARYYLQKVLPLIAQIPEKRRSAFYSNLGLLYEKVNKDSAMAYYQRAIALGSPYAYNHLARLYNNDGKQILAFENWMKALDTQDGLLKVDVLWSLAEEYRKLHNYKELCNIQSSLLSLKDSISSKHAEEDIRGIQERHSLEINELHKQEKLYQYCIGLLSLILLVSIVMAYYIWKYYRQKKEISDLLMELSHDKDKIVELENACEKHMTEKALLIREQHGFKAKAMKYMIEGIRLYNSIMNGETIIQWNKISYDQFFLYYKAKDFTFMRHLEEDYEELSPQLRLYKVLEHMGFTQQQMAHTMVVTEGTLRSYKSRIKKIQKNRNTM